MNNRNIPTPKITYVVLDSPPQWNVCPKSQKFENKFHADISHFVLSFLRPVLDLISHVTQSATPPQIWQLKENNIKV